MRSKNQGIHHQKTNPSIWIIGTGVDEVSQLLHTTPIQTPQATWDGVWGNPKTGTIESLRVRHRQADRETSDSSPETRVARGHIRQRVSRGAWALDHRTKGSASAASGGTGASLIGMCCFCHRPIIREDHGEGVVINRLGKEAAPTSHPDKR